MGFPMLQKIGYAFELQLGFISTENSINKISFLYILPKANKNYNNMRTRENIFTTLLLGKQQRGKFLNVVRR